MMHRLARGFILFELVTLPLCATPNLDDEGTPSVAVTQEKVSLRVPSRTFHHHQKSPLSRHGTKQKSTFASGFSAEDILSMLEELQYGNPLHLKRKVSELITKINPELYPSDTQEAYECQLDIFFTGLLTFHIDDILTQPTNMHNAQAMQSSFEQLYNVEVPIDDDTSFYIVEHRPFKVLLIFLLLSMLESKLLSFKEYPQSARLERKNFFENKFDIALVSLRHYCNDHDIEITAEDEARIRNNLDFVLPAALDAIYKHHRPASHWGHNSSFEEYIYQTSAKVIPPLTFVAATFGTIFYLLQQHKKNQCEIIQKIENADIDAEKAKLAANLMLKGDDSFKQLLITLMPLVVPPVLSYLLSDRASYHKSSSATYGRPSSSVVRRPMGGGVKSGPPWLS